ncbi:MAG: serine hydrolase [Candidatus Krumholzibacteria bacterium]|nr:serine hydrolase [Candidatus Krumholzibacteria bacterium]
MAIRSVCALALCAMACLAGGTNGRELSEETIRTRIRAIESLAGAKDEQALQSFIDDHLSGSLVESTDREELLSMLRTIGRAAAGAGDVMVSPAGEGIVLSLRGALDLDVRFALEEDEPHRIAALTIDTEVEGPGGPEAVSVAPIAWDDLAARLEEEEEAGFSGTVLVVRDGRVVLHEGYGMADSQRGTPNTRETIYCIGSTAIDFTRAAVLLLMDEGKLRLSEPVSRFFSDTPPDKASMTIAQLMTGRSGLPDFHHDPDKDADYDLTWIDRGEAVRRILAAPLLFAPGEGEAHSHSAFVLLAAVVETASGMSYRDFLRERFFEPLGLGSTGFYGPDPHLPAERMAVGYGPSRAGEPNIPANWGPTSWLVMGSGGMVSNPGDMHRWLEAVHSGGLLSGEAIDLYGRGNVLAGGSDRGFLFIYIDDPLNTVLLSSNAHAGRGDRASALARALVGLVASGDGGDKEE